MAANDMAALADVKAFLSITDPNSDTILGSLITGVSSLIQDLTDDPFLSASYDWITSGWGGRAMPLPLGPVSAVASVSGYEFCRGVQNVEVVYTAGYANQEALPMDLQMAVWKLVGWFFKDKSRLGKTSESLGGKATAGYAHGFPPDVQMVIDHYQRRARG